MDDPEVIHLKDKLMSSVRRGSAVSLSPQTLHIYELADHDRLDAETIPHTYVSTFKANAASWIVKP